MALPKSSSPGSVISFALCKIEGGHSTPYPAKIFCPVSRTEVVISLDKRPLLEAVGLSTGRRRF